MYALNFNPLYFRLFIQKKTHRRSIQRVFLKFKEDITSKRPYHVRVES